MVTSSNKVTIKPISIMECPICQEKIGVAKVTLACGHSHCVNCFAQWCRKSSSCPLCRASFTNQEPPKRTTPVMCEEVLTHMMDVHLDERDAAAEEGYLAIAPLVKWWSRDNENKAKAILARLFECHTRAVAETITTWYET